MSRSIVAASVLATILCGCAESEPAASARFVQANLLGAPRSATAEANATDLMPPLKKTFAAKVLAANALESVTGLQTDPARLGEHD